MPILYTIYRYHGSGCYIQEKRCVYIYMFITVLIIETRGEEVVLSEFIDLSVISISRVSS